MAVVIDAADPATWPATLLDAVKLVADRLVGSTGITGDLAVTAADEAAVDAALSDVLVRLYHATRLLPHEVGKLRTDGLRLLDAGLIRDRLDAAVREGFLADADQDEILATNGLNDPYEHRSGGLYAVATTLAFADDIHGVWRLLQYWGGEAVYMAHENDALGERLSRIGVPAVVVITVPAARSEDDCWPGRAHLLVGTLLNLGDADAEYVLRSPVPPEAVEAVWTPGHPQYDRFTLLPR